MSILIVNPYINERLKAYGDGINSVTYSKFLAGQHWDERMLNISYDDVTVDLKDYFVGYDTLSDNFSVISIDNFTTDREGHGWKPPKVNFRHWGWKSFAIEKPYRGGGVTQFFVQTWVKIKTDLFKKQLRPHIYNYNIDSESYGGFEVWFHYPGQLLHSWNLGMGKWFWPVRKRSWPKNYVMSFQRSKMESIKRRNKYNEPCEEDWSNHDKHVMEKIISNAGCRPPHWESNQGVPLCASKESMQRVLPPLTKQGYLDYNPPCRSVTHLPFSYDEFDEDNNRDPAYFRISTTTGDPTFRQVEHTKQYPAQSLIGNTGGYLGLILGYALIQVPIPFLRLIELFKKWDTKY